MNIQFYAASERGFADHGWLRSYHHFSFADFYNPKKTHFGALRVVNDDYIAGGMGFGTHPHDNMEIVTIMLQGALKHRDSMGNELVIGEGEVQRMSAGTGIAHSEFNAHPDKDAHLYQIWVFPKEKNIKPSYEQKSFDPKEAKNRLQLLVSPSGEQGSLRIHQNAWFSRCELDKRLEYRFFSEGSGLYLTCVEGAVNAGGTLLKAGDSAGISETSTLQIDPKGQSQILMIEVPMGR